MEIVLVIALLIMIQSIILIYVQDCYFENYRPKSKLLLFLYKRTIKNSFFKSLIKKYNVIIFLMVATVSLNVVIFTTVKLFIKYL